MVEVKRGAPVSGVLSGAKQKTAQTFDLHSWQGLTEVLKAAREKGLSDDVYASFRDMVLRYAQRGGDKELKQKIDAAIEAFTASVSESPRIQKVSETPHKEVMRQARTPEKKESEMTKVPVQSSGPSEQLKDISKTSLWGSRRLQPSFVQRAEMKEGQTLFERRLIEGVEKKESLRETHTPKKVDDVPLNLPMENEVEHEKAVVVTTTPASPTPVVDVQLIQKEETGLESKDQGDGAKEAIDPLSLKKAEVVVPSARKSLEEHRARISEIKHIVNTRVGNTVALVDAGNEIGREYMNALLEALKSTSGGPSGSLDSAMVRLEKAFELINKHVPDVPRNTTNLASQTDVSSPKVDTEVPLHTEGTLASPPKEDAVKEKMEPPVLNKREGSVLKSSGDTDETRKDAASHESHETVVHSNTNEPEKNVRTPLDSASLRDTRQKNTDVLEQKKKPKAPSRVERTEISPIETPRDMRIEQKQSVIPKPSDGVVAPTRTGASVIENEKVPVQHINKYARSEHDPTLPDVTDELQNVARLQKDIYSQEVTSALNQLLHEWSLFKRSGLLGIGPSGADHPLYKEIFQLPMSSVTAGRFEQSTPDITQSIRDYVNSWQHEQGISYTPGESFEHYLRRVIARILKRQNYS